MAILQGIISLLTRSVGKIFSVLFDWALDALFGRVEGRQKIWLSALMGAAAVWPALLLGVAAPNVAVFAIAFVPLSSSVPAGVLRAVWIALALLVPVSVGVLLRLQAPPEQQRGSWPSIVVRGFPITLGLISGASADPERAVPAPVGSDGRHLSTRELLSRVLHTASQLVSTEMALAREEGQTDLDGELATVKLLEVAGVIGLAGVHPVLVAAVLPWPMSSRPGLRQSWSAA